MTPFRRLTAALAVAAVLPRLVQRGLFLDGLTYASIARNLAAGRGRFWAPSYTATLYPAFYEHPPLAFWLQSLWFRVLGDHAFVERLYAACVALGTASVLAMLWRRVNLDTPALRRCDWLPIAFWIVVPVVSWSIVGNMLETTVSLFTTASVLALVVALATTSTAVAGGWGTLSGLCVASAVLTKGPIGLFPLAGPVIFWILPPDHRHGLRPGWAGQWAAFAVAAAVLLALPEARASLERYLHEQVIASLRGQREVSAHTFTIVKTLVEGVWLPMLGGLLLVAAGARRVVQPADAQRRSALAWMTLGLAGTLPILLSAKQAGHYLVPAVPCFAIAAAMVIAPTAAGMVDHFSARQWRAVDAAAVLLALAAGVAAFLPFPARDRARIADLDAIADAVPRQTTIGICPAAMGDWGLHAWFERRFVASLGVEDRPAWFLKTAEIGAGCPPLDCRPVTDPTRALVLMKCRP